MDGWLVTQQQMIVQKAKKIVYKGKKNAQKIFKQKIEARLVNSVKADIVDNRVKADTVDRTVSNIAFHLRPIWLQTLVAIDSESRL